jgi:hypothetical protein
MGRLFHFFLSFINIKTFIGFTKPLYLEHVDNRFLKLILYYFNKYIFKNHLSTCSRLTGFSVSIKVTQN